VTTEDARCEEQRRFIRIHDAFRAGDLEALRAALEDPDAIPNGTEPRDFAPFLVYAIAWSPLTFIRTLLELGANPNVQVNDGFPPLITALTYSRETAGALKREPREVLDIVRLLLSFGCDPNQRGINDYTPLHMAVAERNAMAVHILLEHGADPELRTRIDDYETPLEAARRAGLDDIAAILERKGRLMRQRLRSGLVLLSEVVGSGEAVRRQHVYRIRLRLRLNQGDLVRWTTPCGPAGVARLEDEGTTLVTELRIDRRSLVNGLFYGVEGMRVGGMRRLEIAPHLAFGERGVEGVIPPHAVLTAEITILDVGRT
jgi:ankyrin repeat protein